MLPLCSPAAWKRQFFIRPCRRFPYACNLWVYACYPAPLLRRCIYHHLRYPSSAGSIWTSIPTLTQLFIPHKSPVWDVTITTVGVVLCLTISACHNSKCNSFSDLVFTILVDSRFFLPSCSSIPAHVVGPDTLSLSQALPNDYAFILIQHSNL